MGKYIGQDISYGLLEKQTIPVLDSSISEYYLNHLVPTATAIQVVCERAILEPNVDYSVSIQNGRSILKLNNIDLSNPGDDQRLSLYVIFLGQQLLVPISTSQEFIDSAVSGKADLSYVNSNMTNILNTINTINAKLEELTTENVQLKARVSALEPE
jgi:hypothetical protein